MTEHHEGQVPRRVPPPPPQDLRPAIPLPIRSHEEEKDARVTELLEALCDAGILERQTLTAWGGRRWVSYHSKRRELPPDTQGPA